MRIRVAIGLLALSVAVSAAATVRAGSGTPKPNRPDFWAMPPPWPGDGRSLREMFERESEWASARRILTGVGYWPWLLNQHFSDDQLRAVFSGIRRAKLRFAMETPVLKAPQWGFDGKPLDAEAAFAQLQTFMARFGKLGMPRVDCFAFDEPIYAARHVLPSKVTPDGAPLLAAMPPVRASAEERIAFGARQTATFIGLMRKAYPRARLGDIEPHPALTYDEITRAVDLIQLECRKAGHRGLDFLRLDLDWALMERHDPAGWSTVRRLEAFCRSRRIGFSLIYWAADQPYAAAQGRNDPDAWRKGVLHMARAYADTGGKPDQVVLESWLHVPESAVPETDPDTFTGSILALAEALRLR